MREFRVTQAQLEYLIERAIVAHISPDSTHAYEKLQDAWAQIDKGEIIRKRDQKGPGPSRSDYGRDNGSL